MKFWSMILVCLVAGLIVIGNSTAKAAPKKTAEEQFKALDTNSDNVLSLEEFSAWKRFKDPAKAEKAFKKANKAGDGKLTLEEFKAYYEGKATKKTPPPQK
jgi:Ca2+-binding EF-hand superfamily protein